MWVKIGIDLEIISFVYFIGFYSWFLYIKKCEIKENVEDENKKYVYLKCLL